jgi:hypothetical protein
MRVPATLAVALLFLAGCSPPPPLPDEQPTFREFRPDGSLHGETGTTGAPPAQTWQEPSLPARGAVLPSRQAPPAPAPPPVQHLPDAAFSEPFTRGPITGYGQGGMQHEPGTPHNPPWN